MEPSSKDDGQLACTLTNLHEQKVVLPGVERVSARGGRSWNLS